MRPGCLLLLLLATLSCRRGPTPRQQFAAFVDDYFNVQFAFSPTQGTANGLHQYDSQIEDPSAASYARLIESLKTFQARLEKLRAAGLPPDDAIDAEALHGQIRSALLDLETLALWRQNPMGYVVLPGGAIDVLVKRNFAPPAERLRAVTSRLRGVPAVLEAMRRNVENPPKEFTDLAIRMASGSVGFFRSTIAKWAKDAAGGDAQLLKDFEAANEAAARSIEQAAAWLKQDLLPRSKGQYAIGARHFASKLLYEEMVELPLDRVLAIGEANLEKDYRDFVETARHMDPKKTPAEVMKAVSDDHPAEQDLLPAARRTIEGIRQFLLDRKVITLPSEVRPRIEETPPYARAGSFASMDTPGPYETKATEAYYYVTPVEKDWDARRKQEHLRAYNRPVLEILTIHEAYPGHYTQFLYAPRFPTKTRKLVSCGTNAEGWAHYSEQMMLEQGFGGDDPKIRLVQLHDALLRDCRYVAGIRLHTQGWTVEQAAKLFVEKGFQEPANAYEEARRGAYNPTYLYYTLGKLAIYKLREDYRRAQGGSYSLQGFHDAFVQQGALPIPLVRRILIPGDGGSLL